MAPFTFAASGGGGGAVIEDDDWVRVDLTDSADPWTKSDPDTTGSSITARSVTVDTTSNSKYVDGCVHFRELKTPEGNDFDYTDKPVTFQGFVMLPNTGFALICADGRMHRPG